MKRLITMMVMVVMVVSVGTVEARFGSHPTLQNPQGYGYSGYGGYSSYGYYGGRYYGDSDAGKMLAAGQLIRDISNAVSSWESTHRTLDMGERAQREEYRNRRDAQSAGTIYGVPVARTEPQKIVVIIKTPKEHSQKKSKEQKQQEQKQSYWRTLEQGSNKFLQHAIKLEEEAINKDLEAMKTRDEKDTAEDPNTATPVNEAAEKLESEARSLEDKADALRKRAKKYWDKAEQYQKKAESLKNGY